MYVTFLLHSHTQVVCSQTSSMLHLGNSACMQFESNGVICPTKLCLNVFTTFAADNIDHNPPSCSAKYFWYETAISSKKQLESKTHGIRRCSVHLTDTPLKVLPPLLKRYRQCTPLKLTCVFFFIFVPFQEEIFSPIWHLIDLVPCTIGEADKHTYLNILKHIIHDVINLLYYE